MDIENLVDMVTKEVMRRVHSSTNKTTMDKEKVLVIASCKEASTKVKQLIEDEYQVGNYDEQELNVMNYEQIIVADLCNKGLSSMALGLCNDKVQEFIVEALFNGKKIYVLKDGVEYRKYSTNANEELYNLFNQYECKVMSYGVEFVYKKDLLKSMQTSANCHEKSVVKSCQAESSNVINEVIKSISDANNEIQEQAKTKISDFVHANQIVEISNKRLITESDLKKLYMNGIKEVNVIKKAILTPLAQDFVRIKQLKISRLQL